MYICAGAGRGGGRGGGAGRVWWSDVGGAGGRTGSAREGWGTGGGADDTGGRGWAEGGWTVEADTDPQRPYNTHTSIENDYSSQVKYLTREQVHGSNI